MDLGLWSSNTDEFSCLQGRYPATPRPLANPKVSVHDVVYRPTPRLIGNGMFERACRLNTEILVLKASSIKCLLWWRDRAFFRSRTPSYHFSAAHECLQKGSARGPLVWQQMYSWHVIGFVSQLWYTPFFISELRNWDSNKCC